jgi:hypothetical protein
MSPTQNLPFNASPLVQEKKKKPVIKETRMARRARERDTQKKARKAGYMLLQIEKAQEAGDNEQLEKLKKQYKAWKASFKKKA